MGTKERAGGNGPVDHDPDDSESDEATGESDAADSHIDGSQPPGWQRVGAACGIAAVVVLVAATAIVPEPPRADASTA
ncbi:MAG: hypothetical protein JO265_04520, partial [Acidimicrobiia bacterium]|nr:hypothetical protein [Acidimicrobiia bacterium]